MRGAGDAAGPTVWYDLTVSRSWRLPPVGVVRAEQECARWFLQQDSVRTEFCYFDPKAMDVFQLSSDQAREILSDRQYSAQSNASRTRQVRTETIHDRINGALKRLPEPVSSPVHGVIDTARSLKRAISGGAETPLPTRMSANVGPNDVFVSLGLDWYFKDLPGVISRIKQQVGIKSVWLCHDMIPVYFPHLAQPSFLNAFAPYICDVARTADHILCNSACTRQDLERYLAEQGLTAPSTNVIRLGCDIVSKDLPPPSARISGLLSEPFLLFVSTIERRKNHEVIYRAYTRLLDAGRRDLPKVIFVGAQGWGVGDFMNDLQLDPRVEGLFQTLDKVSDTDLAYLYRGCLFTVFPSLYEGWGLPVAESLSHGKLCVASNAASIPEVGGDLVVYVDPWDVAGWARALASLIDHPDELKARECAIAARFSPPKWSETAGAILEVAKRLSVT